MLFNNEFYEPNATHFFHLDGVYDMDGVVQKWHRPEKNPGLLKPENPWDGNMMMPLTVFPDPDNPASLKCFYKYHNNKDQFPELEDENVRGLCGVAVSDDGRHWDRPELGLQSFRGSTQNNILPETSSHWTFVHDPSETDPQHRFKGVRLVFPGEIERIEDGRSGRCYYSNTSPDGIHWNTPKRLDGFEETGDTQGLAWDERNKLFRFTTRKRGYWLSDSYPTFTGKPIKKGMPDGRWIAMTTSPDFNEWSPLDNVLVRDPMDELGVDFYCACFFPYGQIYLGFLRRHHFWHGLMDTELVWSYDCIRWNRSWYRQPLLGWGELGDDDWCFGDIVNNKPIQTDSEILMYYETRNHVHAPHRDDENGYGIPGLDAGMGVATMRKDGFVSLESGRMGGSFVTEPLDIAGRTVSVNCRTVEDGHIRFTLLDAERNDLGIEPLQIAGDELNYTLAFDDSESISAKHGDKLSIKIEMINAAVYCIRTS